MGIVNPNNASVSLSLQSEGIEEAKKAREALRAIKEEELAAAKAAKELADAQALQSQKIVKMATGATTAAHVVKDLTGGVGKLSETIGGSLSFFGPWGMAIGGVVALLGQLFDQMGKNEAALQKEQEEISRLAAAYKSLGDSASYAGAQEKLRQEQLADDAAKEVILRSQELHQVQTKIYKYEQEIREIREKQSHAVDSMRDVYDRQIDSIVKAIQKERDRKYQLEEYLEGEKEALAEQKRLREQREDEESEHQHLVAYERERMQKREKEIEEQRQKREKAAADAARQREKELAALAKLRDEAEKMAFKESSAGRIETLEREYEKRKKLAEEEFLDQKRRAQALTQIETMRVIAEEGEKQRIRDELAKKSASITATSSAPQTQTEKAEADWRATRDKILTEVQQLEEIQAQYEREFTATELSSSAEYLAIKDRQIEASKRLAEEELISLSRVSAAREEDARRAQKETFDQVYAQNALTEAQKAAADAAQKGFEAMASGLEAWGVESTAIQKMQMIASGIQAGADAIDYGARALAYFASGNPIAGAGMMAASAGKTAAAAAYAAGVADLGGSAPRTASAPSGGGSYSSSSLTGSTPKESNEITVNFAFEGSDNQIASALIRGLNATTGSLGRQKLKKNVISERV